MNEIFTTAKRLFVQVRLLLVISTFVIAMPASVRGQYSTTVDATMKGDGSSANPYRISTVEDLMVMAANVNSGIDRDSYFKQFDNIDFTKKVSGETVDPASWNWIPIGKFVSISSNNMFTGSYDGNGFRISNFYSEKGGLFGDVSMSGAHPSNIINIVMTEARLTNSTINTGGIINQLIDENKGEKNYNFFYVTNCSFSGSIESSESVIGGIVGYVTDIGNRTYSLKITSCSSFGTIKATGPTTAEQRYIGGIVGYFNMANTNSNTNDILVSNCYSEAKIDANLGNNVGGIAGLFYYKGKGSDNRCKLSDCTYLGEINATGQSVNRIAGYAQSGNEGIGLNSNLLYNNHSSTMVFINKEQAKNIGSNDLSGDNEGIPGYGYTGKFLYDGALAEFTHGKTPNFNDAIWADITNPNDIKYNQSIETNSHGNFISVEIRNASVTLNYDYTYFGETLTIGVGGSLVVKQPTDGVGNYIVITSELVFDLPLTEQNTDGYSLYPQLSSVKDGISCLGKIRTAKIFKKGVWTQFALPYDVDYINEKDGVVLTMGGLNTSGTIEDGDFYLGWYDAQKRAVDANRGIGNWTISPIDPNIVNDEPQTIQKANKGFVFQPDNVSAKLSAGETVKMNFVSDLLDTDLKFWETDDKTISFPSWNSSDVHDACWGFISNPFSMLYDTRNDKTTTTFDGTDIPDNPDKLLYYYVLNAAGDGYDIVQYRKLMVGGTPAGYPFLEPCRPLFVQLPPASGTDGDDASVTFAGANLMLQATDVSQSRRYEVVLTISNETEVDAFSILLRKDATAGYDLGLDAPKMYDAEPSKAIIYSTVDEMNLAVNALPFEEDQELRVPITYYTPAPGNYKLRVDEARLPESIYTLNLLNKSTGETTDLLNNPELQIVAPGRQTVSNLEMAIMVSKDPTRRQVVEKGNIRILTRGQQLILLGLTSATKLGIFDLFGNTRAVYDNVCNNQAIAVPGRGAYIVKIITDDQTITKKIIF